MCGNKSLRPNSDNTTRQRQVREFLFEGDVVAYKQYGKCATTHIDLIQTHKPCTNRVKRDSYSVMFDDGTRARVRDVAKVVVKRANALKRLRLEREMHNADQLRSLAEAINALIE
tara:strand:- start:4302 stop:4646 length:345 start_codon:yes stop_codon:yes gene_type:complete